MHSPSLLLLTFSAVTLAGSNMAETACQMRSPGWAPGTVPDTPDAFVRNSVYVNISNLVKTPSGYTRTFTSLTAAVAPTLGTSYLDTKLMESYDTEGCASACNSNNDCWGFNTFVRRDPFMHPGPDCPNPSSTANFVCTLWTTAAMGRQTTNLGQMQEDFQVVIAGSNGYGKKFSGGKNLNTTIVVPKPTSVVTLDEPARTSSGTTKHTFSPVSTAPGRATSTPSSAATPGRSLDLVAVVASMAAFLFVLG